MSARQTLFRPCIDIHSGVVKQIVGGTLTEQKDSHASDSLKTNWVSTRPASYYANLYKEHNLEGGHVIMLGPGCEDAATEALQAWPNRLQVGGGINDTNAVKWLSAGASKIIVTSWLFPDAQFSSQRLDALVSLVGKEALVVDLSCRRKKDGHGWTVAMNKWQTLTTLDINDANLDMLADRCSEFLIHAADVEGLQGGIDEELVQYLGHWAKQHKDPISITYAGGARSVEDLERVSDLSGGLVDLTIGSALDIFGGQGASLSDCVAFNRR
ncbi:Phosphoribosylformimino-5-aminoimidazole carboxamide ribotide isomerase [Protomyces lactucae-debilis]|uniref:1-(5-phosphoribosyl)-5-[(5-phosphoribosylamino)methylideneamino] imidazole-4-carboxamide isomerase n=1 Tax=Protomyces lactucae-debilis TaxID=2754530 RepID=A0A1Y2FSA1_PROLT|nr:Phosphoribosylformimino-5-aminoimidazole carboxamide ribotide isomerase [Protomyces lactucae-debilis]ORY86829.1 Phosphoribosylformimino-5-aminoimidazole carboxamide ribotide isomerase [Protomyces lactucae-debilis]